MFLRKSVCLYVSPQTQTLGARRTFPGFDEPAFKQPGDITLLVPGDALTRMCAAQVAARKGQPLEFATR